ncbi:hypothetical protein Ade02nite_88100 [Paractinoplanes deccanensis]|uniref:Serine protease n=1 Tax=Paractinoplanes deccanensis TaxID=113561 RepID=A0ABQ3YJI7_9ACTN|nr:trypsin-like serine protease [Actinoplanes deccanensis]GID80169.1 hypothetical protein Ade02nite_88100 [Actinoplanes deccanensis]
MAVELLRFSGEQSSPTGLERVYAQDPVLARGEPPEELVHLRDNREIFLSRELQPRTERVEKEDIWRVTLPVAPGLPGQTAVRESPADIAAAVDPDVGFAGYRPDWMPLLPAPRPAAGAEQPVLRRFNGKATRPLYVFPPENRAVFQDTAWPWGVVGKVFTSAGWYGTGALIGPRLMVTAAHVVPWNNVAAGNWWMRFVPAYFNGTSLHGAGVESYVSDVRGYNPGTAVTGYDYAVCRLYNPLGNSLGWFGYNGYSESWNNQAHWTLLGYPGAVAGGERPSWQGSCSIFDVDGDSNGGSELETRADVTGGNSGGPLFGWWNGDPRVIGVVSGEETDWIFPASSEAGNVVAGGSGFTNLCAWGRTNWP